MPKIVSNPRTLIPDDEEVAALSQDEISAGATVILDAETVAVGDPSSADIGLDPASVDVEFEPDTDEVAIDRFDDTFEDGDDPAGRIEGVPTSLDVANDAFEPVGAEDTDSGFSLEETPTSLDSLKQNMVRLTVVGPDGLPFWFTVDRDATIGEAEVEISAERWLPRVDAAGQLVWAWRLSSSEQGVLPSDTTWGAAAETDHLSLVRVPTRIYRVELVVVDGESSRSVRQGVSGALRVAELTAYLRDAYELPARRWQLRVDDTQLLPEALLEDVLADGVRVELSI
jgi:hypothetical protein